MNLKIKPITALSYNSSMKSTLDFTMKSTLDFTSDKKKRMTEHITFVISTLFYFYKCGKNTSSSQSLKR